VLKLAEDHAHADVSKRSVPMALRLNASEIAPGIREIIAQSAAFVEQQKRDAEAIAAAKAKFRDILAQKPGDGGAAAPEDRQRAAIMPHRTRTKWEYAQWITEDCCVGYRNSRTETFNTDDPCDAWVSYEGDSDSPDRGKFLSQLLGQPEAEGYATDAEILNAIGLTAGSL
jgi:hypothetical protein